MSGAAGRLLLLAALLVVGCSGTPRAADVAGARPTGGWTVLLTERDEAGGAARYRVDDGVLHYGGGLAALRGQETWSTPLRDEEATELVALLDRVDWLRRPPEGAAGAWPRRDVVIAGPSGRRRFVVRGPEDTVDELVLLLDRVARRRLDPFLETLPQPDA